MPSLANIYCHGVPSGLTLTGNLYPDGSDTKANADPLTVTEATNRKTTYVLNAGVTGLHLIHLLSGSNVVWVGWTPPNLAITGNFEACETRRESLNLDAKISDVPAAVRDVSNASPAVGSLGEMLKVVWTIFNGITTFAQYANKLADHFHRRKHTNIEASSDGDSIDDAASSYGTQRQIRSSNTTDNEDKLTILKSDGSELDQLDLATSANADPVTGVSD